MAVAWSEARGVLERVVLGPWAGYRPDDEQLLEQFARLYDWHVAAENELVYPAAARRLDAAMQVAMGAEMAARRGLDAPR